MDIAPNISPLARRKPTHRSSITNGTRLFAPDTTDGRSIMARRFRDLVDDIATDLGGKDHLSTGQLQLIRRAAMMGVQCEILEAEAVAGKPFDVDVFGQLTDRLGRCFQRLGLERKTRDVSDDIDTVLARVNQRRCTPNVTINQDALR
jgi:hypothetical protein